MKKNKARIIAIYLPQFYPIKENNEIWGKGFTEWTNVSTAKPQYKGHYQPQIPSELGFYDLRLDEVRKEQIELAKEYGIEGFCYWHYWFGNNKTVLDLPLKKLLENKKLDFPFCLAWANHSWLKSTWQNASRVKGDKEFIKQEYLGKEDYIKHFNYVLPALLDKRYMKVDGKPIFAIFQPEDIPSEELKLFIKTWNELSKKNGLKGIHFIAKLESVGKFTNKEAKEQIYGDQFEEEYQKYIDMGFNAIWSHHMKRAEILSKGYFKSFIKKTIYHGFNMRLIDKYNYKDIINNFYAKSDSYDYVYPTILPRWDKTPRQGNTAVIYDGSTPNLFYNHVKRTLKIVKKKKHDHKIIFLQSWNEWGEGNYMEPDIKYGRKYLEALKKAIIEEDK